MTVIESTPRELDTIALGWQRALDAGRRAVNAERGVLPSTALVAEQRELGRECDEVRRLLTRIAADVGAPKPWLPAWPVTPHMLGVPSETKALIFDLDGVLTDSGALHAAAWAGALDPVLLATSHQTGRQFVPFDPVTDYALYFDGRPRLEGIHLFLEARGLRLPPGSSEDAQGDATVREIARHKGQLLEHGLLRRGVATQPGARRYLLASGYAGLARAVVSASMNDLPMLRDAELTHLAEVRIDADTIRRDQLRSRPSPDVLLAACRALGVGPDEAVTLTHSGAGIVAGLTAGMAVVGVASGEQADQLRAFGATCVVPSLAGLLEPRLRES